VFSTNQLDSIINSPYIDLIYEKEDIDQLNYIVDNWLIKLGKQSNFGSNISLASNKNIYEDCLLRGNIVVKKNCTIGRNVKITGNIFIDEDSTIADDCLIRGNSYIGKSVKLGKSVEIKDSIVLNNSLLGPLSFIGNSIIGSNSFLGALVRTSNVRLDQKDIYLKIKNWEFKMGKNFGCLVGTKCSIGVQSSILPGRSLMKNYLLPPNTCFFKDEKK